MSAIGAIGSNPFSNTEWLSKGVEETSGTLASGKGVEETSGTLAKNEPGLFDGKEVNGIDNGLFANNEKNLEQEETAGQLAGAGFSLVA